MIDRIDTGVQAEKVTKKFYDEFSKQRKDFIKAITGIADDDDRAWYAAIMLNRLMFSWFLQSKGLLDNDPKYLRTKLEAARNGKLPVPNFQSFYETFLKALFHDALNQPADQRDSALKKMLGNIPYINGGIFDRHRLETENTTIRIPDSAFEGIFALFGQYDWHLDDRPIAKPNEINPDVLGHIFEKFVNQKEKGAYYTKEDVTGYMSQNTIIPWLLDNAKKKVNIAFDHTQPGSVWRLLQNTPEKYIYGSMKHGVIDTAGEILPMPEALQAGENDYSQRGNWNQRAEAPYALSTETWREYFHRRKRTLELIERLRSGEVHEIDDLITLNLDIRQFVQDIVATEADVSLVKALWHGVDTITILDPTVGSGAFLFAAVRVLEPIADELLNRMDALVEAEPSHHSGSSIAEFKRILDERNAHPNQRYFIMRQIILNNLYGVDIEEEAVEICKLRLFLLLVAHLDDAKNIEPLPDLDFNILAGNTLVGYANEVEVKKASGTGQLTLDFDSSFDRISKLAAKIDLVVQLFRESQTQGSSQELRTAKSQLLEMNRELNRELDSYLMAQSGKSGTVTGFSTNVAPLHWYSAFYDIIVKNGGFNVVIGNPPYVETSTVTDYTISSDYKTSTCGNLYANVLERSMNLMSRDGRLSMIVPLSGHSTSRMQPLVDHVYSQLEGIWIQNLSGDAHPSTLFEGVNFRLATVVGKHPYKKIVEGWTTGYRKWFAEERPLLFETVNYTSICVREGMVIPKLDSEVQKSVESKLLSRRTVARLRSQIGSSLVYYHNTPVHWIRAHASPPYFESERDGVGVSTQLKTLRFAEPKIADNVAAGLCSTIFFQHWIAVSDCYHLNKPEVDWLPIPEVGSAQSLLSDLSKELEADMKLHSRVREYNYKTSGLVKYDEFYMKRSKSLIDQIDKVQAHYYRLTEEEMDWLINFMWKYRMGNDD